MRLVEIAHERIQELIQPGDITIDATIGNGHDISFLAEQVGESGVVYGYDIQEIAHEITSLVVKTKRLHRQCKLIHQSHAEILQTIDPSHIGKVALIVFNLGYLPHGEKSITTLPESTQQALDASFKALKPGGALSILSYRGHSGGEEEHSLIEQWISRKTECDEIHIIENIDSSLPEYVGPHLWILMKQDV